MLSQAAFVFVIAVIITSVCVCVQLTETYWELVLKLLCPSAAAFVSSGFC